MNTSIPLFFIPYIGKDIAEITEDYAIKNISGMGVVCVIDSHGCCKSIWHGPN